MSDFDEIDKLVEGTEIFSKTISEQRLKEIREEQKISMARRVGRVLKKDKELRDKKQSECTHMKNGVVFELTRDGIGDALSRGTNFQDYAVIKHQMFWGDIWVRCLRCGKWWKPGDEDYKKALQFPTRNTTSSSIIFNLPDENIKMARDLTRGTH